MKESFKLDRSSTVRLVESLLIERVEVMVATIDPFELSTKTLSRDP